MRNARLLSIFLLAVTSLTGLFCGYHMISDSTGSSLGLPFYLLNGSVFTDYAILGWGIFILAGVFSGLVVFCIFRKIKIYPILVLLEAIIICAIIFIQIILLGESFMIQYVYLIIAFALIGLGVIQNQRRMVVESEHKPNPVTKSHHHKHRKHK
jgi:hypothetical protein